MALEFHDNPSPSLLMVEAADETDPSPTSLPAAGQQRLIVGPDHLLYLLDDGGVATAVGGGGFSDPMTTRGDMIVRNASNVTARLAKGSADTYLGSDGTDLAFSAVTDAKLSTSDITTNNATTSKHGFLKKLSNVSTEYMDGTGAWSTPAGGGGGSITTVTQGIGANFTTGATSTWTDITGLTGISLTAGTWMGFLDLDTGAGANFAPVYRISDGSTIYGQGGHLYIYPGAVVSNHYHLDTVPFVLGGSATMKVQYYSDTAHTIYRYPVRGGGTTVEASSITFVKVA